MTKIRRSFILVATVSLMAVSAVAQTTKQAEAPMSDMPGMAKDQTGAKGAADHDMMAGMTKMNQAMSAAPMTGDADRDFVAMMVPHHEGAIDMAQIELKYGKDPVLRRLARDIVAAQNKEIATMHTWQAKHPSP